MIENVKRGFNIMKDAVGRAWSFVKNRAIAPVVDWFTGTLWPKISGVIENVKKGFDGMKDAVGKAWQGVKNAAIEPVNFVINKVYNEGIYSNFKKIRKHIQACQNYRSSRASLVAVSSPVSRACAMVMTSSCQ